MCSEKSFLLIRMKTRFCLSYHGLTTLHQFVLLLHRSMAWKIFKCHECWDQPLLLRFLWLCLCWLLCAEECVDLTQRAAQPETLSQAAELRRELVQIRGNNWLCAGMARAACVGIPCGLSSAQRNNNCCVCCWLLQHGPALLRPPATWAAPVRSLRKQFSPDTMMRITGFKTQKAQWLLSSEWVPDASCAHGGVLLHYPSFLTSAAAPCTHAQQIEVRAAKCLDQCPVPSERDVTCRWSTTEPSEKVKYWGLRI